MTTFEISNTNYPNLYNGLHYESVLDILHVLNNTTDEVTRNRFVNLKPTTSNYLVFDMQHKKKPYGCVTEIFPYHLATSFSFFTHMNIANLTSECKLGLDENQYQSLQTMRNNQKFPVENLQPLKTTNCTIL